jgi:ketosteroid isomerase-like protein
MRAPARNAIAEVGAGTMSEADVLEANESFYRAFNLKDVAAMDAVWSQSANVTCIHPGWNLLQGREKVMTSWRDILSNPAQPKIVSGGATVSMLGTIALVSCRELVAGSPLVATNVFLREEEGWRLIHHHSGPVAVMSQ